MMEENIKCIVTGGAGFIGSHLCDFLIKKGFEVYCLDNLITGSQKNIDHLLANPKFHFLKQDVSLPLPGKFLNEIGQIKYIYHLASPASPPQYQKYSIETLLVNSQGTYFMLELAKKHSAWFLPTSTSEVYGDPLEHPQKETYFGHVNPVGIRACYDEAKRFSEAITMEYVRKFKVKARIARIFNTYGPKMQKNDGRVISNFINQALSGKPLTVYGNGAQTRSFCYVDDMVRGLVTLMEKENLDGEIINLGMPKEHTIKEIADYIRKVCQSSSTIEYLPKTEDDPSRRKPDITKAQKLLGWQPTTPLQSGIQKTISYFKGL